MGKIEGLRSRWVAGLVRYRPVFSRASRIAPSVSTCSLGPSFGGLRALAGRWARLRYPARRKLHTAISLASRSARLAAKRSALLLLSAAGVMRWPEVTRPAQLVALYQQSASCVGCARNSASEISCAKVTLCRHQPDGCPTTVDAVGQNNAAQTVNTRHAEVVGGGQLA